MRVVIAVILGLIWTIVSILAFVVAAIERSLKWPDIIYFILYLPGTIFFYLSNALENLLISLSGQNYGHILWQSLIVISFITSTLIASIIIFWLIKLLQTFTIKRQNKK